MNVLRFNGRSLEPIQFEDLFEFTFEEINAGSFVFKFYYKNWRPFFYFGEGVPQRTLRALGDKMGTLADLFEDCIEGPEMPVIPKSELFRMKVKDWALLRCITADGGDHIMH